MVLVWAALALVACSPEQSARSETTAPPPISTTVLGATAIPVPPTSKAVPPTTTTTITPSTTVTEPAEEEGVIIAVDGGLQVINSFTLLTPEGELMTFVPGPDLLFGGGPLSHLREHLVDGLPVHVVYIVEVDATNVAIEVDDAS